ncbi:MAG: hypothetical protein ACRDJH_06315 [Thermomicrobiales bacterium]
MLATNPSDEPSDIAIEIDPSALQIALRPETVHVCNLDGNELETAPCSYGVVRYATRLEPDGLRVLEITPESGA